MTQLRFVPATFAASAVLLLSSLASAVVAPLPGCGSGPACAVGFECTVVGGSGCASAPPCAAGQSCPTPEPCVNTVEMGCTPAHCTADAECAAGMVCHTWTEPCAVTDCACAPDVPNCNCGGPTTCQGNTVSMCTPRYLLPCQTANDCGDGFTCEEQMVGCATVSSSGGGSAPNPGSAGAAPTPPDGAAGAATDPIPMPVDPCGAPQPTGVFQCVAKEFTCQTAAQCPAGWSCLTEALPTMAPAPACSGNDCAADPVAPTPTRSVCQPPYYGVNSSAGLETPTASNGTGTGTGTGKGTGTAGTSNGGTPESAPAGDASSHESAACQMGHAPASTGALSLLAMLGALFGLKRRRAQR